MFPEISVDCFLDKQGVSLVIPVAKRPGAGGVSINRQQTLPNGCTPVELGLAIRTATQWCDFSLFDPTEKGPELTATGARSYSEFAKRRIMVNVAFIAGIKVTPTARDKRGRYHGLVDQALTLPSDVLDEALGKAVLQAFTQCQVDFIPAWERKS